VSCLKYYENVSQIIFLALVRLSGSFIKQAPGFSLRTGLNGLEANLKLGREVTAEVTVDGFAALVLNPNAANVTQVEGAGGDGI
jgi:hypothetical protein